MFIILFCNDVVIVDVHVMISEAYVDLSNQRTDKIRNYHASYV